MRTRKDGARMTLDVRRRTGRMRSMLKNELMTRKLVQTNLG